MNKLLHHMVLTGALLILVMTNMTYAQNDIDTCTLSVNSYAGPNYCSASKENTFFATYNCLLDSFHVLVFNRWGSQVFEATKINFVWHTTEVKEGVYYYLITYNNRLGRKEIRKGVVNVMH